MKTKNKITCRYCNKEFDSMIDSYKHICSKKRKGPSWGTRVGRNTGEIELSKMIYPGWLKPESLKHLDKITQNKLIKLKQEDLKCLKQKKKKQKVKKLLMK